MRTMTSDIPDIMMLEPRVFRDERGFFFESWNALSFSEALGFQVTFVQDNHSNSIRNVLRGLHYQIRQPQGKLVRVVRGRIFDVAVDLRRSSKTFGQWLGTELSDDNFQHIWVPPGFAHGFLVLSDTADVIYKTTDYYAPEHERCLAWDDPDLGIAWPLVGAPILSSKDRFGLHLKQAELFE